MPMVRKQLYIAPEQQRKLHRLAERWHCSEAEVVRKALDCLPDPEGSIEERLRSAGLLVEPSDDPDIPSSDEELDALERELDDWLDTQTVPLHLSEIVMEDRR